jgi:uncharacterized protein YraI
MNALQRPGRAAAVVGAVVAVSATTLMGLVAGTASATPSGQCLENVNVRAEPSMESEIIGLCEAGRQVRVGESRNGFVELTSLGGWAAAEFVSVEGATPATASEDAAEDDESSAPSRSSSPRSSGDDDRRAPARPSGERPPSGVGADNDDDDDTPTTTPPVEEPEAEPRSGGPLGGLL